MNSKILKDFIRSNGYAWPGGYPCALMMADGEVIDAQAARENFKQIVFAMRHPEYRDRQWIPVEAFIHWEGGPLYCAHSNREIPSAYGEVD